MSVLQQRGAAMQVRETPCKPDVLHGTAPQGRQRRIRALAVRRSRFAADSPARAHRARLGMAFAVPAPQPAATLPHVPCCTGPTCFLPQDLAPPVGTR